MDELAARIRQIICAESGQEVVIQARCSLRSKAKCQKCGKKEIEAMLKRKPAR